jgi:hypothetical protein
MRRGDDATVSADLSGAAVDAMHRIEKMRHCMYFILGARMHSVKRAAERCLVRVTLLQYSRCNAECDPGV